MGTSPVWVFGMGKEKKIGCRRVSVGRGSIKRKKRREEWGGQLAGNESHGVLGVVFWGREKEKWEENGEGKNKGAG